MKSRVVEQKTDGCGRKETDLLMRTDGFTIRTLLSLSKRRLPSGVVYGLSKTTYLWMRERRSYPVGVLFVRYDIFSGGHTDSRSTGVTN